MVLPRSVAPGRLSGEGDESTSERVLLDFTHRSDIKRVTHPNQRAGGGGGGAATAGANVVDDHPICGRYDSRSVGWTTEERMGQRAKERKGK